MTTSGSDPKVILTLDRGFLAVGCAVVMPGSAA